MDEFLVVIDMEDGFITGFLGSNEAQEIVPNVINKIKEFDGVGIIATYDKHNADTYYDTAEGKKIPLHCADEKECSINFEIAQAIRESKAPYILIKKDTFGSQELINIINNAVADRNIGDFFEIKICGVCTDICVISNALMLRSVFPFATIIVDASCCAGTTPENHRKALDIMKANCIVVIGEPPFHIVDKPHISGRNLATLTETREGIDITSFLVQDYKLTRGKSTRIRLPVTMSNVHIMYKNWEVAMFRTLRDYYHLPLYSQVYIDADFFD